MARNLLTTYPYIISAFVAPSTSVCLYLTVNPMCNSLENVFLVHSKISNIITIFSTNVSWDVCLIWNVRRKKVNVLQSLTTLDFFIAVLRDSVLFRLSAMAQMSACLRHCDYHFSLAKVVLQLPLHSEAVGTTAGPICHFFQFLIFYYYTTTCLKPTLSISLSYGLSEYHLCLASTWK